MAYDEDLAERVRNLLTYESGVAEQRMFGGLAFLIGGHMAVGVSGQGGREMRGWLRVDEDAVGADPDLELWLRRGVAYARSLPPKG